MKKLLLSFCFLAAAFSINAQSTDSGKSSFYYQKYLSAETFFHQYLQQNSTDDEAWLWLVRSYLQQNKLRQALDSFSLAPAEILDRPYALITKGTLLLATNKKDSARQYFEKAISSGKSKKSVLPGLIAEAQVLSENGDLNYAIDLVSKALKKAKNDPWLYTTLGRCYRSIHDGSNAYRAFATATDKNENYAAAYYELGKIFQSQKNPEMYLSYFMKAVAADKNYAPAYYELYYHYMYTDPLQAINYFKNYTRLADPSPGHDYAYADLLYLTKNYTDAIAQAQKLIKQDTVLPRLYKLIAYSYAELKDTTQAFTFMKKYFDKGDDSIFIAKDYETMAALYISPSIDQKISAIDCYLKAVNITDDSARLYNYYAELAKLSKAIQDYTSQAKWLGKYYRGNETAGNVDLFNWGIAAYRAGDFALSDTAFRIYTEKYPGQTFGYYWRAKSNAAIDTAMENGLAIPYYQKLTELISPDSLSSTDKKWITEAYSYLGAYETNTKKNYDQAISYFEKILVVDPENESAKKYINILEETLEKKEDTN